MSQVSSNRPVYPFTAIVGNEQMRLALLLTAVHPALGGVLVRGKKGTAKSTAVRALAALLPELDCVRGCPYNCDPGDAAAACDECAGRIAGGEALPSLRRRAPVVELPIGATEDRVAGSLDLETAIQSGARRFEPGLLARANRGILYMDEVNLLGDHLVDLLLDAAALGRNYVEREGISFSHPACVVLVGTMNPEEGELRPQLLDRFALAVDVAGVENPAQRGEAVRNRVAFEADPAGFAASHQDLVEEERGRLGAARVLLPRVSVPPRVLDLIVHLCIAFGVDGLRADLALYRAASALAAYEGRTNVTEADVRAIAPLVLAHRRRRQPFEQPGLDEEQLDAEIAAFDTADEGRTDEPSESGPDTTADDGPDAPVGDGRREVQAEPGDEGRANHSPAGTAPRQSRAPAASTGTGDARRGPERPSAADRHEAPAPASAGLTLPEVARAAGREGAGRSGKAKESRRGSASRAAAFPSGARVSELALLPTLSAAAPYQRARHARATGEPLPAIILRGGDLRRRVREGRTNSLVLFVVDASGSMGARERMAATKGAVLALLLDAYRRRDSVGLITFRGAGAELVLPPTNSVDLAERRLASLRTGGRTPLAAGIELAGTVLHRAAGGARQVEPLVVLVSDGRANSAAGSVDPMRAARAAAERLRAGGTRSLVLDGESGRAGAGFARALAGWLGARYLRQDVRAGRGAPQWREA